jgi:hypothetical protein
MLAVLNLGRNVALNRADDGPSIMHDAIVAWHAHVCFGSSSSGMRQAGRVTLYVWAYLCNEGK